MKNMLLSVLTVAYVLGAVVSFGHSANRDIENEFPAFLNCMFLGAPWPYYASYVYFNDGE